MLSVGALRALRRWYLMPHMTVGHSNNQHFQIAIREVASKNTKAQLMYATVSDTSLNRCSATSVFLLEGYEHVLQYKLFDHSIRAPHPFHITWVLWLDWSRRVV
jgi:hypothetical protein